MAGYELTGTVKLVMDAATFGSGFTKREFVVTTTEERYPQDIKFECVKERCALLDAVAPGQRVTVSFDIRGKEYKGRYYVDLTAWKIGAAGATPADDVVDEGPPIDQLTPPAEEQEQDMPF